MRSFLLGLILVIGTLNPMAAQDRQWLGKARMFTNDKIGDGQDRWRSGSYSVSWIRGASWGGELPSGFGALMEFRIRSEVIAPANLVSPIIGTDRRYAGLVTFGAFSHMQRGARDMTVGLDLVLTGPMTGVGGFQSFVHNALGMPAPGVLGSQLGNAVYPTVSFETGQDFRLSDPADRRVSMRPYLEAQAGVETFVRFGADLTFGDLGSGDMMVRNVVSGFRNVALKGPRTRGTSFILGGDIAYVQSSALLPTSLGYTVEPARSRLRAGIYSERGKGSYFYGLTWLSKEFVNQPDSQVVGSFTVRLKF